MTALLYLLVEIPKSADRFAIPVTPLELSRLGSTEQEALAPYLSGDPKNGRHLQIDDTTWVPAYRKMRGLHGFFMGQAMKETRGAAAPELVSAIIDGVVGGKP